MELGGKSKISPKRTPFLVPKGSCKDVGVTGNNQVNVSSSCAAAVQNVLNTHRRSRDLNLFLCTKAQGYRGNTLSCFQVHTSKKMLTGWKGIRERYMSNLRSGNFMVGDWELRGICLFERRLRGDLLAVYKYEHGENATDVSSRK